MAKFMVSIENSEDSDQLYGSISGSDADKFGLVYGDTEEEVTNAVVELLKAAGHITDASEVEVAVH